MAFQLLYTVYYYIIITNSNSKILLLRELQTYF